MAGVGLIKDSAELPLSGSIHSVDICCHINRRGERGGA